jgi:hypothetical protein
MATYKVYLSREKPRTSPYWNFSTTVVATDATVALNRAYDKWVDERPNPAPPALSNCSYLINPV